ncbi:hypothetical protein NIES4071_09470 [Calothrix sp. NIES-4071]|nr:hypothetical protein NIES4071_09470 [Calothrix sp. NIES-4071]BAZ55289.1 hypothetical protein NIES4105_09430 [Calothrix sp. NIES-4105]
MKHALIGFFDTHTELDKAIGEVYKAGFPLSQFSIVGKEQSSPDFVSWQQTAISGASHVGQVGAVFGGLLGLLVGSSVLSIPGLGAVFMAGPIAGLIAGEVGGLAAGGIVGTMVGKLKFAHHKAIFCEQAIQAGKYALLFLGTPHQQEQIRNTLLSAGYNLDTTECQ